MGLKVSDGKETKRRGRSGKRAWITRYKLLYTGWMNSKALLYSTGDYSQYAVISNNGEETERFMSIY